MQADPLPSVQNEYQYPLTVLVWLEQMVVAAPAVPGRSAMTLASTAVHRTLIRRLILVRPRSRRFGRVAASFICVLLSRRVRLPRRHPARSAHGIHKCARGNALRTFFHARDR